MEYKMMTHAQKDILHRIDLPAFALSQGYREHRSTLLAAEMAHPGSNDRIVLTRSGYWPWQYRATNNPLDCGTVVDFLRTREGKSPAETFAQLRAWEDARTREDARQRAFEQRAALNADKTIADAARAAAQQFLESRGITREVLTNPRFDHSWDTPLHIRNQDSWRSRSETELDDPTSFRSGRPVPGNLVIAPNTLTALSHYQCQRPTDTEYVALVGKENPGQGVALQEDMMNVHYYGTVIVAKANDRAGDEFAERVGQLFERVPRSDLSLQHHAPTVGRTWNDQLQLSRSRKVLRASPTIDLSPQQFAALQERTARCNANAYTPSLQRPVDPLLVRRTPEASRHELQQAARPARTVGGKDRGLDR